MTERHLDFHSYLIDTDRERDIEEARSIQQAMLRAEPLRVYPIELACKFRPVEEVGGDFLDYFWMADRRLALYLGDVAGKGLPAALYGALAVGILRGINKGAVAPSSVLEFLNRRLLDRQVPGRYCTVQYAVVDPPSRQICFVNAGLLPRPLHISATGCRQLGEGGLPCSMFRDAHYDQHTVGLAAGDAVLFSTDGLIEAENSEGEEFGIERLIEVCEQNKKESAATMLERAFEAVDKFAAGTRQRDDMTAAILLLA